MFCEEKGNHHQLSGHQTRNNTYQNSHIHNAALPFLPHLTNKKPYNERNNQGNNIIKTRSNENNIVGQSIHQSSIHEKNVLQTVSVISAGDSVSIASTAENSDSDYLSLISNVVELSHNLKHRYKHGTVVFR